MTWATYTQFILAVLLGAHLYSCGRAGASLLAPVTNALQRAAETISRRKSENGQQPHTIAPDLRS